MVHTLKWESEVFVMSPVGIFRIYKPDVEAYVYDEKIIRALNNLGESGYMSYDLNDIWIINKLEDGTYLVSEIFYDSDSTN